MTNETSKTVTKPEAPSNSEIEHEDEIGEDTEILRLSTDAEKETIQRDTRRKIELYWEKKRLRDEFEDFDESEFGF